MGGNIVLSNIYLLKFNNYYNRQVKKYDSLSGYNSYLCQGILNTNPIQNVNFIPNDGVNTTQVINWDGETPDYLLVCEGKNIISRWFIIESVRQLNGQFKLTLQRDLVADYYDTIIEAPMFIEKGWVNANDSAIWNSEDSTFNEIKTREDLLMDSTKCPWIVGYCAPGKQADAELKFNYGGEPAYDFYSPTLEEFQYYDYLGESKKTKWLADTKPTYLLNYEYTTSKGGYSFNINTCTMFNSSGLVEHNEGSLNIGQSSMNAESEALVRKYLYYQAASTMYSVALTQFNLKTDNALLNNLLKIKKGTILKTDSGFYELEVKTKSIEKDTSKVPIGSNLGKQFVVMINGTNAQYRTGEATNQDLIEADTADENSFMFRCKSTEVYIEYKLISFLGKEEATFPKARQVLNDAPYCMFCIPYGAIKYKHNDTTITTEAANSLNVATGIAQGLSGVLYDLQLVPYCPIELIRTSITEYGTLDLDDQDIESELNPQYFDNFKTVMFFAKKSTGSFNIKYNFYLNTNASNALDYKVKQQTTKFRLCSPNYAGIFEYNPYKFSNDLTTINVDYTYKPYQPYIHLNPNFSGLYGKDFDDARGLICGGDYSLAISADAWKQYELNNKNYQLAFDRQIENMEINNAIQKEREKWSIFTGTAQGSVAGATTGGMAGGGWGALAGGVAGGVASLGAGLLDWSYNEKLRQEAIDYTKDQFGYQLGNIKALPYTLAKVSAYNANNKLFPFIEIYEATNEERQALKDKILYNGMSIGRIGKLIDYIPYKPWAEWGYFKGKVIRLEDLGDDFHVANKIADELNKGVYII